MSRIDIDLNIDLKELKKQIDAVNGSALPVDIKGGLHNLLGTIRDAVEDKVSYQITSVCKDDILIAFTGNNKLDRVKKRVKTMDEGDMSYLARKLAGDYCEQLYWDSLRIIFEDRFLGKGEVE